MSYLKSVYGLVQNGANIDVQNIEGEVVYTEENSNLDPSSLEAVKFLSGALRNQLPVGSEIVPSSVFDGLKENGPVVVYSHAIEHLSQSSVSDSELPLQVLKENVVTTKADFKRNISKLGLSGVTADAGVFGTDGYALYGESSSKTDFVKVHSIDGVKPELKDLKGLINELNSVSMQARSSVRRAPTSTPGM